MKVSVITVNLNGNRFLPAAIKTVVSQDAVDLEYLIIDGGSTDESLETITEAAAADSRIRWVSERDRGISDAMNKGTTLASGDIITFLHADDFYPKNDILHRIAENFRSGPELEWLTGGLIHVDRMGHILRTYSVRHWSYHRLLRGNIVFHPATFIRRDVLLEVGGYNTGLRYAMDYDLWLRLGRRSSPLRFSEPLAAFRVHPDSRSVQELDAAFREEFQVRCCHLQGKPVQKALHQVYFWLKYLPNRLSLG